MKNIVTWVVGILIVSFSCTYNSNKATNAQNNAAVATLYNEVQQNPTNIRARIQLITSLDSLKYYKEALQEIDVLITKDSLNYGFWFLKGKVQQNNADTSNAIISYQRAMKIYANQDVLLALANLYAETKNNNVFVVCNRLDELKLGKEYDSYTAFFKGIFYARLNDTAKAIEFFEQCIANNYTFMDAYVEEGALYYENKQFENALKVFELAVSINNTYANAYYWMGKCNEALNNTNSALSNYQKALAFDKTIVEANDAIKRLSK